MLTADFGVFLKYRKMLSISFFLIYQYFFTHYRQYRQCCYRVSKIMVVYTMLKIGGV